MFSNVILRSPNECGRRRISEILPPINRGQNDNWMWLNGLSSGIAKISPPNGHVFWITYPPEAEPPLRPEARHNSGRIPYIPYLENLQNLRSYVYLDSASSGTMY